MAQNDLRPGNGGNEMSQENHQIEQQVKTLIDGKVLKE